MAARKKERTQSALRSATSAASKSQRPADGAAGAGMYLHWEGRRGYRTRMPAPRVLEPVP